MGWSSDKMPKLPKDTRFSLEERRAWRQEFEAWHTRNSRRFHMSPVTPEQRKMLIGEDVRRRAKTCFKADTRHLKLISNATRGVL